MPQRIAVITGPTATGKTKLGVMLALELGGEIVSADSMQIYRRMDIGTAKPDLEERRGVAHHMLDVADPGEPYSVARYVDEASRCVDDILARGKLPIIVGGTGLYIDSLLSGRTFAENSGNSGLRRALGDEYDKLGGEAMLRRLRTVDPARAEKLAANDKKRILRALEVYALTGKTITQHDEETKKIPPRYDARKIVLSFSGRAGLYGRIDKRVDEMVRLGLFGEVRALLADGLPVGCTAMQAIGYKEAALAIRGQITEEEAIELIKHESRRYAKRQLTWLRRDKEAHWIFLSEPPDFDFARQESTNFVTVPVIE